MPAGWPSAGALGGAQCYVFQTREFVQAWLDSYLPSNMLTPLFVEVRDRDEAVLMLLPLCLERRGGLTTLGFIDQGLADYNAAIVFPDAARYPGLESAEFWDQLFAALPSFDIANFDKLQEKVGSVRNPIVALANTRNDAAAHGSSVVGEWSAVEAAAFRSPKEMRRKLRLLERLGPVKLLVADTPELREKLLGRLIAQKQRRYEETNVSGFAEKPEQLEFLRRATDIFSASGQLVFCALMVGEAVTAVQWGLALDGRLYALVTSFESGEFARYSCGRVLAHHLLRWLYDNGYTYFDQGVGDEGYKIENSTHTEHLSRAVIIRTARGRVVDTGRSIVARLKATPAGERARQLRWTVKRALRGKYSESLTR